MNRRRTILPALDLRGPAPPPLILRPYQGRDRAEVLAIDRVSFPSAVVPPIMRGVLDRQGKVAVVVAEQSGWVRGFAAFGYESRINQLMAVAVCPPDRRAGVGTQLLDHVKGWSDTIDTMVDERWLVAQLFFRSCGFRAVPHWRGRYTDDEMGAIRLRWESATDGGA